MGAQEAACASNGGVGNAVFGALPTTIFEVMSTLSRQHNSTNLGQGFPDDALEGPASMKEVLSKALLERSQQYPPMLGVPELRQAVAAHSVRYCSLPVDPNGEVLITCGATEALAAAFLGLLNAGDEVVIFEPCYDSYVPMVRRAGGMPVFVQLQPPSWSVTEEQLRAAFSPRTRLVVINTPHNPTGKVWSREELQLVAELCQQYDAIALCDEVYEHLAFPGTPHLTLRSLPGMAGRCLRIGSAGKTFSFTAWKVGWLTGPRHLVKAAVAAHQFLVFTVHSAAQLAVAHGLTKELGFCEGLGPMLEAKRQLLASQLQPLGMRVLPAQGTYFLIADVSSLLREGEDDIQFCYRLTQEAGVTLIPVSAFYENRELAPKSLVRFAFCKTDEKLQTAVDKLRKYFTAC